MKTRTIGTRASHLLVLDAGDDVLSKLKEFAKQKSIEGASFMGIGAFQKATVAWWNLDSKEYEPIPVDERVEVLSITGSVARSGNDVKIHAHVTLGRRYGPAIGGHLLSAEVNPTLEIFLTDHGTRLERRRDEATRLWLLDGK